MRKCGGKESNGDEEETGNVAKDGREWPTLCKVHCSNVFQPWFCVSTLLVNSTVQRYGIELPIEGDVCGVTAAPDTPDSDSVSMVPTAATTRSSSRGLTSLKSFSGAVIRTSRWEQLQGANARKRPVEGTTAPIAPDAGAFASFAASLISVPRFGHH